MRAFVTCGGLPVLCTLLFLGRGTSLAQDAEAPPPAPDADAPSITVYSSADPASFDPTLFLAQQRTGTNPTFAWQVPGFAVVKETRAVDLAAGRNQVPFTGVAEFLDPTTVSFADLTSPSTTVLEQSLRFDLASPDKILERYVDQDVGYETMKDGKPVERVEGRVLSVNQGTVVLQAADGLRFVPTRDPGLRLPALPRGLLTKPTLVWKVDADTAGSHRIRTTYQTSGLTWRADYNLVLDASDTKADVGAWVTLLNVCGAGWAGARLKLVAGDVSRVAPPRPMVPRAARREGAAKGAAEGFEEKAFFEYHLYTLPRAADLLENSTQQITLFPTARDVGVDKLLVYYGLPDARSWGPFPEPRTDRDVRPSSNPKIDVYVRFKNAKENHMGMPLPKGKVRVYKVDDADGTLEFVGEDLIDHTPKDETVLVKVGQAFDVVGERTQTEFTVDTGAKTMTESYRIVLRNRKETAVKVAVRETMFRWTTWAMVQTSDPFVKLDARTVHFEVDVPPGGEKVVTYTVRYSW